MDELENTNMSKWHLISNTNEHIVWYDRELFDKQDINKSE